MSKKIIRSIGIILTIITLVSCFLINPKHEHDFTIIGNENSYAMDLATKNNINFKKVYDSNKDSYQKEAQVLKYIEKNNYYEVNEYDGISNIVIIPDTYNNNKVISINKDFLKNNQSVKKIVIGKNIESIDMEIVNNYKIECYENDFCKTIEENDNIKNIDHLEYSYLINNLYFDFPYEFNINNNSISLEKYIGNDKNIVIPSKYNGYNITKINFDIDKTIIKEIYISDNIIFINIDKLNIIKCPIILNIISLIVFILLISIQSNKNLKENVNNANNYILVMLALLINLILSLMFMLNYIKLRSYIFIFLVVLLVEILFYIIFNITKKLNIRYDNKIKVVNNYKNDLLVILKYKKNNDLKELMNVIKYMDPVSNESVNEIEQEIKEKLESITSNTSKEEIQEIISLVNKRNLILKNSK